MKKAVIFDFDGTLCDTGIGVKKSAKYALDAFNIDAPDWEDLDFFIGPPLLVTFQEKFGQSASDAEKLVKKYRERYTNIGLYESEFYNSIPQLLQRLKNDGMKLGIASSKPSKYVEELLIKENLIDMFGRILAAVVDLFLHSVKCGLGFNACGNGLLHDFIYSGKIFFLIHNQLSFLQSKLFVFWAASKASRRVRMLAASM